MSNALYRLGRFAARRPWTVIGTWVVLAVLVVAAAGIFGQKLENTFGAPGLDSQHATELLTAAGNDQAGLTAQVVVTPRDEQATFATSPQAQAAWTKLQTDVAGLPNVLDTSGATISPDGRVAIVRLQYPVIEDLTTADLKNLKSFAAKEASGSPLRIEMGGDLFFAFEEPETGRGELIGLIAAVIILLVAFGSLIAMGLPIGIAIFGLALGISSMSLVTYLIDIPSWAPIIGSMVGLGVGIDYALFLVTRHREYLARGPRGRRVDRPGGRDRRSGRRLRRWHRRDRDPRSGGRRRTVHDRRRHRHLDHRADHGRRLDHPAARVPRARRPLDQPARSTASRGRPVGAGLAALGPSTSSRHARTYVVGATVLLLALGRAGAGAARRFPGRGHAARQPHRTPGLRPRRRGLRSRAPTARWSSPSTSRGTPSVVEPLRQRHRGRPGHRRRRAPAGDTSGRRDARGLPDHRPAGRRDAWTPSSGCAPRCSRAVLGQARREPTSVVRRRLSADLGDQVSDRLPLVHRRGGAAVVPAADAGLPVGRSCR